MKVSPLLQVIGLLAIIIAAFFTDVLLGVAAVGGTLALVGHFIEGED